LHGDRSAESQRGEILPQFEFDPLPLPLLAGSVNEGQSILVARTEFRFGRDFERLERRPIDNRGR
jgi:hypothetical protein